MRKEYRKKTDAEKAAHSEKMKAVWAKRKADAELLRAILAGEIAPHSVAAEIADDSSL